MPDRDLSERVLTLELLFADSQKEIAKLEERVAYYDKMALKWGWFVMGMLTIGAAFMAGVDRIKEKAIAWFLG